MIRLRTLTGLRFAVRVRLRRATGLADFTLHVRGPDGIREVGSSLQSTISPISLYATGNSKQSIQIATDQATVEVTGGSSSYSYAWSADKPGWDALQPTSVSCAFRSPAVDATQSSSTNIDCVVTDSITGASVTASITAIAFNFGEGF